MPDNDDVRRVKERLDIVDIIGDKVRLRRAGRNYIGLCPFHGEKTPSFSVSQEGQFYHCFGCGRGGDVFTFVMETEGMDFPTCLEFLAERAGVTLSRRKDRSGASASSLFDVMNIAQNVFSSRLKGPEGAAARAYMERRSLTPAHASRFGLGWAPNSWDDLRLALAAAGVTERQGVEAGLLIEGQRGSIYDRFRGRLMFPIRDIAGRVIAFGGRIIDGEGAKYINSPEGGLYSKRRNLYLLHDARESVRARGRSILVEGYMDAVRLHISGFTETVASLGTSLTEEQGRLLKRFADRCYICYDSDTAGQDAALRGMYILQKLGLDVMVISLPSGKDPDELLCSPDGGAMFEDAIGSARPLIIQHLHAVKGLLEDPQTRRAGVESLFGGLVQLEQSSIAPNAPEIAGALGLFPHDFWSELDRYRRGKGAPSAGASQNAAVRPQQRIVIDPLEAALCSIIWRDETRRRTDPEEVLSMLSDERVRDIAMAIMLESPDELEERWLSLGDRFPMALISRGHKFCEEIARNADRWGASQCDPWDVVCADLTRKRKTERKRVIEAMMKRNEATGDDIAEFQRLSAELKAGARR